MGERIKPQGGKIEGVEDVDSALREIGLAQRELDAIDAKANEKIAVIREKAAKDGEKLRNKVAELSAKIQAFADYNRDELFRDRKSIELASGTFGYRKTTKISVKKTTLGLIKKLVESLAFRRDGETDPAERDRISAELEEWNGCIRIKEDVSKDALGSLSDERLMEVGAARKVSDDFFCEAKTEEVNKDLLKKSV